MALFIQKFGSREEAELFLQGGIIGGTSLVGVGQPKGGRPLYLHGETLIFTGANTDMVTFAATPANAQVPLSIDEVISQIGTQTTNGVLAKVFKGRLLLRDAGATPSAALGLSASSTALAKLGFEAGKAVSGTFYAPPEGAPPRLVSVGPSPIDSNTFCVVVERT